VIRRAANWLAAQKSVVNGCRGAPRRRFARAVSGERWGRQSPVSRVSSGRAVLVVDDDASLRELLTDYLRQEGFDVSGAEDGTAMFEWLEHTRPTC
jgi:PleD family two-component response regulator